MPVLHIRADLTREVFAIDRRPVPARAIVMAVIGMTMPVVAGVALGRPQIGLTFGLGATLLGGSSGGEGMGGRLAAVLLAAGAAAAIGARPWGDAAVMLLVAIAGLVASYGRTVATVAIRFSTCLVLCASFAAGGHDNAAPLVFAAGALWNLTLLRPAAPPATRRAPDGARFRARLRTIEGWQFPLRLALGLGIASAIRHAWPAHHYYWITLTVVLLTRPAIEHVPVRAVQRLFGTMAGVAFAAVMLICVSSPTGLCVAACVLAGMLPVARARSYLVYSAASTPLILLVLDIGKPVTWVLLVDRLTATLAAGAIVIALNVVFDRLRSWS